jgi:pyruvate,water dikinase
LGRVSIAYFTGIIIDRKVVSSKGLAPRRQVYVMCEIPSNVLLIDEFSGVFDGFSIGSNDLTQLTLGLDRDSGLIAHLFDERNPAVTTMLDMAIVGAKRNYRKIGICGQAPSDYPEFAKFLIDRGIDSISLNPDSVIKTRVNLGSMSSDKRSLYADNFIWGIEK